jgi:hypothetical protein
LCAAKGKVEVELFGEFGTLGCRGRGAQPPEVIGALGCAGKAADGGLDVLDDGSELGMAEGVSSELAPRRLVETVSS